MAKICEKPIEYEIPVNLSLLARVAKVLEHMNDDGCAPVLLRFRGQTEGIEIVSMDGYYADQRNFVAVVMPMRRGEVVYEADPEPTTT
jgi:hypothetical protein